MLRLSAQVRFALQYELVGAVNVIARQTNLQRELLLVGNRALRQPVFHLTPHIRPPVGVVVIGTATPETDLVHVVETQRPQSLHDRRAEGTIHEHRRHLFLWRTLAQYLSRHSDQHTAIASLFSRYPDRRNAAAVQPTAETDNVPCCSPARNV